MAEGSEFCLDEVPHGWGDDRLVVAGDAFVGVDSCEFPPCVAADVAGVVVDLSFVRGDWIFVVSRDAGVSSYFADGGLP